MVFYLDFVFAIVLMRLWILLLRGFVPVLEQVVCQVPVRVDRLVLEQSLPLFLDYLEQEPLPEQVPVVPLGHIRPCLLGPYLAQEQPLDYHTVVVRPRMLQSS